MAEHPEVVNRRAQILPHYLSHSLTFLSMRVKAHSLRDHILAFRAADVIRDFKPHFDNLLLLRFLGLVGIPSHYDLASSWLTLVGSGK